MYSDKYVFQDGEELKRIITVSDFPSFAAQLTLMRCHIFTALSGSIVGNVTGSASSAYLRGVAFFQIPTTLLAAVNSSGGGNTGVHLLDGMNLVGPFHQPSVVLCDPDCFDTLSDSLFADGAADSIKYRILSDQSLFEVFESRNVKGDIENIVSRCVEICSDIFSHDDFDSCERQKLHLWHPLCHAIERCTDFAVSHGLALVIGTVRALPRGA
jgi:3-dehydroquinate synthetase